jgi:hypothetical protein
MLSKLKRAWALLLIRDLERQHDDIIDALQALNDQGTHLRLTLAREAVRAELVKARARYHAMLPPGTRRTWHHA